MESPISVKVTPCSLIQAQDHREDVVRGVLHGGAGERAGGEGAKQKLRMTGGHLEIVAGGNFAIVIAVGPPVSGNHAVEAPFAAQNML